MKADKNLKPKAHRTPSIPEDEIPHFRYYNQSAIGLKLLFERAADGKDLEYVERLKRVSALILKLAGAMETYQQCEARPGCEVQYYNDVIVALDLFYEAAAGGSPIALEILHDMAETCIQKACILK
jgi:hypothetical protein